MKSKFKNSGNKKVVQCELRPLHAFFLDVDDSITNSEVGHIICMNFESARVTLLRHQFANGGPVVKRLSIANTDDQFNKINEDSL